MEDDDIIIGIDLGTTNSCVSVWRNQKVEDIQNKQGNFITPSIVGFSNKDILIGDTAKSNIKKNYENTIYGVKRLIGRLYDDKEVQDDIKHFPFKTEKDESTGNSKFKVKYEGKTKYFSPEEISSYILKEMKEIAENYLGKTITDAVITVPAYFNDKQRKATEYAGKLAGLDVRRIINEPTAAALAYGLDKQLKGNKNILVFDLGGGTFDVTILSMRDNILEVRSTRGDMHLGGDDFDNELMEYCLTELKRKGNDYYNNQEIKIGLKIECEKAKIVLSNEVETKIYLESIDFDITILRAEFEFICKKHFDKLIPIIELALEDANLKKETIDEIVLVGGSTRIPKIQQIVKDYFNKEIYKYDENIMNVDKIVSMGAAIQASIISGCKEGGLERLVLLDVTPLSLGLELSDGKMDILIKRNTTIPTEVTQKYKAIGKEFDIKIYQGEDKIAENNTYLGKIPIYIPQNDDNTIVTMMFNIDLSGILTVSADYGNGEPKELIIDLQEYLMK